MRYDQYGGIDLKGGARTKAKKKMYKDKHCSPGESDVTNSCLDGDLLIKIASALNKMSDKKLAHIDTTQGIEDIHGDICLNISEISSCSSEECWGKIKNLMNELGSDKEKFKGPTGVKKSTAIPIDDLILLSSARLEL